MRTIYTFILFFHTVNLFSQTTIFVNQNATGGSQDGSNWSNAFPDLQQALSLAVDGDAIWVAAGTYYPTSDNDRSISFVLKQGVKLLGGFVGNESTAAQRDFLLHETILSGNIGLPDGSDNSSHVLRGEGLDSTTVLDGFVVTHGNADSPGEYGNGGGLLLSPSQVVYNTCPIIQNCRFEHNYAFQGGAISADRVDDGYYYINPIIRNCQFFNNHSTGNGGAISKTGPALLDNPFVLENCIFEQNSTFIKSGGGVYIADAEFETILRGCSFVKDSSKFGAGGGMYFDSGYKLEGAELTLENCSFRENIATTGTGIMAYGITGVNGSVPSLSVKISACDFEKNIASNGIGAAYYIIGLNQIDLTVNLYNCKFNGNSAKNSPITYISGAAQSTLKIHIEGCEYYDNRRLGDPTGYAFPIIYGLSGSGGKLDAIIENCLFTGNGGGISSVCSSSGGKMNTLITNCTFYNNSGFIINKSFFFNFDWINNYVRTTVRNSIIWEPTANLWSMFGDNDLTMNQIQGYFIDHNLISLDSFQAAPVPPIFGYNNITHKEPLFADAANRDFRLLPCSPGVNAGENIVVDTLNLAYDLDGNPRIAFDNVDMGAYEAQDSCFTSKNLEPLEPALQAIISPNPVGAGEKFGVQVSGFNTAEIHWAVWDIQGREVSTGKAPLPGTSKCWLTAPFIPGVYVLKLWNEKQVVVQKIEVKP